MELTRSSTVSGALALLAIAWLLIVIARIAGPSDLYDKEQPRTTSYTADILVNHHWILPYDTFGIPATKPPFYNWLSVPFVSLAGYQEWALKAPSILASAGVLLVLLLAGRHLSQRDSELSTLASLSPWALGIVAAIYWLATAVSVKLLYIARPDMLLVAVLCGAWLAATILLDSGGRNLKAAIAFWLCTLAAALDKGPLALFALLYLILAALLIHRNWRLLLRTGWQWGLPLLLIVMGAWCFAAYQQDSAFFQQVLLGRETANRVASPTRFFTTFFNGPAYLITRFLPWSLLVILALVLIPPRRWFKHPLAPAILWLFLWLIIFSFATTKRPDRYAPVYPAMALIAAYCALSLLPRLKPLRSLHGFLTATRIVAGTLLLIIALCLHNQFLSDPAKFRWGDNAIHFADAVRAKTGTDPILFLDGEQTPLETLLGNVQPDPPPLSLQQNARWCIHIYDPASLAKPTLISDPIAQVDGSAPGQLGLYFIETGEGIRLCDQWRKIPVLFVDDFNTQGTADEAAKQWRQFWRLHSAAPASH